LPNGLSLSTDGTISGTPIENGTFTFTVKASNFADDDTKVLTLFIGVPPAITRNSPPGGTVGTWYGHTFTAIGDHPIMWELDNSILPDGLTMSTDGVMSGTPTTSGTYTFVVKASNASGNDTFSITIYVTNPPTILTESVPGGVVGTAYNVTLDAVGDPTIIWTIEDGKLPTGLMLSSDGIISGTPKASGTFTFTVKAANHDGEHMMEYTIVIEPASVTVLLVAVLALFGISAATFLLSRRAG
jgi:plastocyanin domain-containing protein